MDHLSWINKYRENSHLLRCRCSIVPINYPKYIQWIYIKGIGVAKLNIN